MARESFASAQAKIQKEIDRLRKKQESIVKRERGPAINHIVDLMKALAITPADLSAALEKGGSRGQGRPPEEKSKKGPKREVAPKYRDPESGKTWSGRGRMPLWIAGAEKRGTPRDQFLIQR